MFYFRLGILLFLTFIFHPVHVSVTNIEYMESEKRFEVSFKLFYDDFETIISEKYNVQLHLGAEKKLENEDIYFLMYIKERFQLFADGEVLEPSFKSRRMNDDSIWLYFYFEKITSAKKIEVRNSLMMDLFMDQKNLVIIKSKGLEKGYILKSKNDKIDIHLSND